MKQEGKPFYERRGETLVDETRGSACGGVLHNDDGACGCVGRRSVCTYGGRGGVWGKVGFYTYTICTGHVTNNMRECVGIYH